MFETEADLAFDLIGQAIRVTVVLRHVPNPEEPMQGSGRLVPVQRSGLGEPNRRCERIGEEMIGGRNAIAWRAVSASGRRFSGWIDRERRFPLRVKTEDGTIVTAEHFRDEPQPAELFQIPSGFRKFDPQVLIDRIKQSDVWVTD